MTEQAIQRREETAVATTTETDVELSAGTEARAMAEIQATAAMAQRFPRNEDQARQTILRSCERPAFAEEVTYRYPRGGSTVEGLSIYFAREAARLWGNLRYGTDVVRDDGLTITLRSWAWDAQTNTQTEKPAHFKRLIYRKSGGWVQPDERDLRELINKHSALGERNCLLALFPEDLKKEAEQVATKTRENRAAEDPDGEKKKIIAGFGKLNVKVADVEQYLGHALDQCSPVELGDLRSMWQSIKDGNSKWSDYVVPAPDESDDGGVALKDTITKGRTKTMTKAAQKRVAQAAKLVGIVDYDEYCKWLERHAGTALPDAVPADLEMDLLSRLKTKGAK